MSSYVQCYHCRGWGHVKSRCPERAAKKQHDAQPPATKQHDVMKEVSHLCWHCICNPLVPPDLARTYVPLEDLCDDNGK
jgi:hypothetical protein